MKQKNEGANFYLNCIQESIHKGLLKSLKINEYKEREEDFQLCLDTLKAHANEIKFIFLSMVNGKVKVAVTTK